MNVPRAHYLPLTGGLASLTGLMAHLIYNRREPSVGSFFRNYVLVLSVFATAAWQVSKNPADVALVALLFGFAHLATLGLSIAAYRLFFHPLRNFPGPTMGKLTKWTAAYHGTTGFMHEWLPSLHEKYGDIVRFGPNELSFSNPAAVKAIHGVHGLKLHKGPFYDSSTHNHGGKGRSLPNTRDFANHRSRRRVWEHGFAQKSLRTYEPRIRELLDEYCYELGKFDGQSVDLAKWVDYFTFDAMGHLVFDQKFGLLQPDGPREFAEWVRTGVKLNFFVANIPWVSPYFKWLPVDKEMKKKTANFTTLASSHYKKRRPLGTEPNDIFSHLIAGNAKEMISTEAELQADSPTLFIAGSDTSAVTSTFIFYHITNNKEIWNKLRKEIDSVWDGVSALDGSALGHENNPYLTACINESLRIMPAGPNGMQRFTNEGGHTVDGTFIPEFTAVSSNTITLHQDPKNWTKPLEYIPERWIESLRDPSWNHDVRAFIPFSGGTFSCVGKPLALLELRMFVATTVKRFDLVMEPDFDHEKFMGDVRSYMTTTKGALPITVHVRKL